MRKIEKILITLSGTTTSGANLGMRAKDYADPTAAFLFSTYSVSAPSGGGKTSILPNTFIRPDTPSGKRLAGWVVGRMFPDWFPGQESFLDSQPLAPRVQFFGEIGGFGADGNMTITDAEIALVIKEEPAQTAGCAMDAVIESAPPRAVCQMEAVIAFTGPPPGRARRCELDEEFSETLLLESVILDLDLISTVRDLDLDSLVEDLDLSSEVRDLSTE